MPSFFKFHTNSMAFDGPPNNERNTRSDRLNQLRIDAINERKSDLGIVKKIKKKPKKMFIHIPRVFKSF
jgi:hypothetical protein